MRKLFLVLVAIFLMATSVHALSETETGPQEITVCYMTGTSDVVSGSVVVLQTTSPTYIGREVTGTTTEALDIYGVVVDTNNYTPEDMASGKWVRVQTYGYTPIVRVDTSAASRSVTAGNGLYTSGTVFRAVTAGAGCVTGNVAAMETSTANGTTATVRGFIGL